MKAGIIAFALLLSSPPPDNVISDSQAAVRIFKDACIAGSIRISPQFARIITPVQFGYLNDIWQGGLDAKKTIYEFTYPRYTYLVIADPHNVAHKSFVKYCVVISRSLTARDAMLELISGSNKKPIQSWRPNIWLNEWTLDWPEQRYRESMKITEHGLVMLQVAMYAQSSEKPH